MKVLKKQPNSNMCLICGIKNTLGVKAPFYEMEDGKLVTEFMFKEEHQSYPGRVHGGMISCMLDELAGRAIWITEPKTVAVTTTLTTKFRKLVPYNVKLRGVAEIIKNSPRGFEAHSKILDENGTLLAEGTAIYFKMPMEKITYASFDTDLNVQVPDDVTEIDI